MLLLNDIHVGFNRAGGTTPSSRETLRTYLMESIRQTLDETKESHTVIVGDLFDGFEVTPRDWIDTYVMFSQWVGSTLGRRLTLVAGNHDHSPKAARVSSFEMLARVLTEQFPTRVSVIGVDQWAEVEPGVIALAHCSNQDMFNLKLNEIQGKMVDLDEVVHILLHANFDNNFAAQGDHSLNVSRDVAIAFKHNGAKLVFAHEHQAKTSLGGHVVVLGNQWPTSVADCLGNDAKFAHVLKDGEITKVPTWGLKDPIAPFHEVDWRELDAHEGFVRVTGTASSTEASEVINAIAKFRLRSPAFVVTNAVAIDGIAECEALPANFEAVKKFDVMEFIRKNLDADEMVVVQELIGEHS